MGKEGRECVDRRTIECLSKSQMSKALGEQAYAETFMEVESIVGEKRG